MYDTTVIISIKSIFHDAFYIKNGTEIINIISTKVSHKVWCLVNENTIISNTSDKDYLNLEDA